MALTESFINDLKKDFASTVIASYFEHNEFSIEVDKENITAVLTRLRDIYQFEQLIDLLGVDRSEIIRASIVSGYCLIRAFDTRYFVPPTSKFNVAATASVCLDDIFSYISWT